MSTPRTPHRRRPSGPRVRTLLAATVLGLLGALGFPAGPASAHAVLVGTNPAQGSLLAQAPPQVVLTFTEAVNPVRGKVRVIAPDGERADTGDPRSSGTQLIIGLRPDGRQGTYLVTFRVISADSHPVAGSFTYSVGVATTPPRSDEADPAADPFIRAAFPVVRWVGYVGLLLMVGAVSILALLWPQRLARRAPVRVAWLGAGLIAAATVGELALQAPYVTGGAPTAADIRDLLASQFGAAHLVRLGVLGAVLVLLRPVLTGRGWGADRVLLAVLGTIGVATWSVSGHPSATEVPMVTVVADMIHLAAVSLWLGGLVMLAAFLLPRANGTELGAIVPVWSRWATYAVLAIVLTGIAQSLVAVRDIGALFSTQYGWTLVIKVALVGLVLLVALGSRRLVAPLAAQQDGAARRLRGVVIAEAGLAALVLAAAALLVQTTPAATAAAENAVPEIQSAVLHDPLFVVTVDIQPVAVGLNDIHLYATTPDGQPADVKQWQVRASLPAQGIEPITAVILPVTPDHAIGQVGLPVAGAWTFAFTLRVSDIEQSTVSTTFVVR